MGDDNPEVIDLTQSFTFRTTPLSCDSVIELDDSVTIVSETDHAAPQTHAPNPFTVEWKDQNDSVLIVDSQVKPSARIIPTVLKKKKRSRNSLSREVNTSTPRERSPIKESPFGDCPICFDTLGKNPLASTKCGHVFCFGCLEQSLRMVKKCPACRKPLNGANAYHRLYFGQH